MKPIVYIAVSLGLLAFLSHLPALYADFVNIDDRIFITLNPMVQKGLTVESLRWCFSLETETGWAPLAWVSYLIDYELFGLDPAGYHAVNLIFHAVNTALLFILLARINGRTFIAAFVAAIFAVHPQHVESVAWVAERRDVLFMFFCLLTLYAYHHYAQAPSLGRYLLVTLAYAVGLMCKPMLVTLPVLMLLLDYWPLARTKHEGVTWQRLAIEKLPWLAMAGGASVLTVLIQRNIGATIALDAMPLSVRLTNAPHALAMYLWRMIWPTKLAFFYPYAPYAGQWLAPPFIASVALLAGVSIAAWRTRRTMPWLITGWLWFLISLAPVCGIFQVGAQASADRYTYLPMLGIYVAVACTVAALRPRLNITSAQLALICLAVVGVLTVMCWRQTRTWHNAETLCRHALAVTRDNAIANNNLGTALLAYGSPQATEAALPYFREAVRIRPDAALFQRNLGTTLADLGQYEEAVNTFVTVTLIEPDNVMAHYQLAVVLAKVGNDEGALKCLEWVVEHEPDNPAYHYELGVMYEDAGRRDEALRQFKAVLRLEPDDELAKRRINNLRNSSPSTSE